MRTIIKQAEPRSLTAHRKTPYSDFDNYTDKDTLRLALASEQRGLCCYCMGRIRPDASAMKIEHWLCQSECDNAQLDYGNLLGACRGGEGRPWREQHCDTRKGKRGLRWNPANPAHMIESRLQYDPDGFVRSNDSTLDDQLNSVLNLNLGFLKQNRKGVLDAVLHWWRLRKPVPRDRIEQEILRLVPADGWLDPYCQVAVWWLNRKLSRMPR